MVTQSSDQSANRLMDLIAGHRVTAVIYTAAKLGIADLLLEGPKSAPDLARLSDTHPQSLLRLMRGLVTLDLCTEVSDSTFQLTEIGTLIAARSERSLKPWALMEGEMLRAGWSGLIESIRRGKTGTELAGLGQERFERLAETKNASLFNEGMVSMTRAALPPILGDSALRARSDNAGYHRMPCCQTHKRTLGTTDKNDLDRTGAASP